METTKPGDLRGFSIERPREDMSADIRTPGRIIAKDIHLLDAEAIAAALTQRDELLVACRAARGALAQMQGKGDKFDRERSKRAIDSLDNAIARVRS